MLDSIFFGFKITSLFCYEFIARCFGRKRLDSIKNICLVLSDRNVMYTKILQSISCAGNFLTSEEMDYLSIYNDKAPYKKNEEYNIAELVEQLNKGLFFKNFTLAPLEKDLINYKLLDKTEKNYLFRYHLNIYSEYSSSLNKKERKWLASLI